MGDNDNNASGEISTYSCGWSQESDRNTKEVW